MMQIEYIAQYFDRNSSVKDRIFSPAGVAKMDYYLYVLKELGYNTLIYSTCATNKNGIQRAKHSVNKLGQQIHYRSSFGSNLRPQIRYLDLIFGRILLFLHLLFSRDIKNTIFIVYHERLYTPIIRLASKFRKLNIIMDVEELYSVAANSKPIKIQKEIRSLNFVHARYIFPTHRLREIIIQSLNINYNAFAICSGNYLPPPGLKIVKTDKTIIYAGTFEKIKGSAIMAINAAKFLPDAFTLYICGFGTAQEIADIKARIIQHNITGEGCKIEYRGSLAGDEYIYLISKCEIGLAIQDPNHEFNNTSFPSKILEYLRFGLKVVSSDVGVVREDKCSSLVTFFSPFTPESLANTIVNVSKIPENNSRKALVDFHEEFKKELSSILE